MKLDTYNSTVDIRPPGPSYQRADTRVGDAMQGFGANLSVVSDGLQKMQDREGALWVSTTMAEQQKQFSAKLSSAQASGNVQPGFYQELNKEMEESYQTLLKKAPGQQAKDMLTHSYASMATGLGDHAMRMEAAYHGGNILGMAQQAVNDAVETGQNTGNYALTAETVRGVVSSLHGNVSPQAVDQFQQQADKAVDAAQLDQLSQQNPEAAAQAIESEQLGSSLPAGSRDATAKSLKRNAAYSHLAGQTQADLAANSALALAESGDFSKLDSARAAYIQGKSTARGGLRRIDEERRAGEVFDTMAEKAQAVYSIKQDLLGLAPSKYGEVVNGVAEKFGAGSPQHILTAKIATDFSKQAATDPLGFVLNDPLLKKEYNAAIAGNDDTARHLAFAKVVSAQEQAGLQPRVLTRAQAQQMGQAFTAMFNGTTVYQQDPQTGRMAPKSYDAASAMVQLQALRSQFGQYLPNVIADLSSMPDKDNRLPMAARFVLEMPANDMRGYVALANSIPPKDANGKIQNTMDWGKTEGKDWENAISGNSDFRSFISASGQTGDTIEGTRRMVTRIASSMLFNGQASNPADAVKQAVANTIGAVSTVSNGVIIPKYNDSGAARTNADMHAISVNMNQAKNDLLTGGHLTVPAYLDARFSDIRDPELKKKAVTQALANETSWQTTPDGKGAQLMAGIWQNGKFMPMGAVKMAGRPVIMDFSNLEKISITPVASGFMGVGVMHDTDWSSQMRPVPAVEDSPEQSNRSDLPLPQKQQGESAFQSRLPEGLKGLGEAFQRHASAHGIDPALLAAISMHETGNGTSSAFRSGKNAMGVSNSAGPISFNDPSESIAHMAERIGSSSLYADYRKTGKLEDLAKVYAPIGAENDPRGLNKDWVSGVSKYYKQLKGS